MASIPRVDVFPMRCPECATDAGFPFKATTIPDRSGIDVAMRCHACRHEWLALMEWMKTGQQRQPVVVPHQRAR